MLFKSNELRRFCFFYGPIIMYNFADVILDGVRNVIGPKKAMLTNILLLSAAMICLSSRV